MHRLTACWYWHSRDADGENHSVGLVQRLLARAVPRDHARHLATRTCSHIHGQPAARDLAARFANARNQLREGLLRLLASLSLCGSSTFVKCMAAQGREKAPAVTQNRAGAGRGGAQLTGANSFSVTLPLHHAMSKLFWCASAAAPHPAQRYLNCMRADLHQSDDPSLVASQQGQIHL